VLLSYNEPAAGSIICFARVAARAIDGCGVVSVIWQLTPSTLSCQMAGPPPSSLDGLSPLRDAAPSVLMPMGSVMGGGPAGGSSLPMMSVTNAAPGLLPRTSSLFSTSVGPMSVTNGAVSVTNGGGGGGGGGVLSAMLRPSSILPFAPFAGADDDPARRDTRAVSLTGAAAGPPVGSVTTAAHAPAPMAAAAASLPSPAADSAAAAATLDVRTESIAPPPPPPLSRPSSSMPAAPAIEIFSPSALSSPSSSTAALTPAVGAAATTPLPTVSVAIAAASSTGRTSSATPPPPAPPRLSIGGGGDAPVARADSIAPPPPALPMYPVRRGLIEFVLCAGVESAAFDEKSDRPLIDAAINLKGDVYRHMPPPLSAQLPPTAPVAQLLPAALKEWVLPPQMAGLPKDVRESYALPANLLPFIFPLGVRVFVQRRDTIVHSCKSLRCSPATNTEELLSDRCLLLSSLPPSFPVFRQSS
jgi:hypothetical protein